MHLSFFLLLTSYCPLRAPGRAFRDLIKSCQPTQRCHRTMTPFHGRLPQKGIKSWEVLTSSIYIIVSGDVGCTPVRLVPITITPSLHFKNTQMRRLVNQSSDWRFQSLISANTWLVHFLCLQVASVPGILE